MAVGINADTDVVASTTNLPTSTNFTALGWAYVVSDAGAASQGLVFLIDGGVNGPSLFWDGADNLMYVIQLSGGAVGSAGVFASRPAVATWFQWYLRCSGTGANLLQGGWRAAGSTPWVTGTATHTSVTPVAFALGVVGISTPVTMNFAGLKLWDAVLTDDELRREQYITAVRRTNLRYEWPLANNTDTRDLSGNGFAPTLTSVTSETDPPIQWAPQLAGIGVPRTRPRPFAPGRAR